MKDATFKIIFFPKLDTYAAVAWNYDEGILFSTSGHVGYTEARVVLGNICRDKQVNLRWFDGEYMYAENGQLLPID